MEKYFSSQSERIKILRSRNMTIDNSSVDKNLLYKYNYYNLINAYKDLFLYRGASTSERYITGTKLTELEALMKFDINIRLIFLSRILLVEEIIKNQLVQSFYQYHLGINPDNNDVEKGNLHRDSEYLRRKYYDLSTTYSQMTRDQVRGVISTTVYTTNPRGRSSKLDRHSSYDNFVSTVYKTLGQQRKNKHASIKQYSESHGYVPMWILVNVLTFGNMSHFFTFQCSEVQLDMIKSLKMSSVSDEISILNTSRVLQILSIFRNICAHNERFYTTEIKVPIDDAYMNFGKRLPFFVDGISRHRNNASEKKKRDAARQGVYSLLFCLSLFLDKVELNELITELRSEFKVLDSKIDTVTIADVERKMGLNFDWYKTIFDK